MVAAVVSKSFDPSVIAGYSFDSSFEQRNHDLETRLPSAVTDAAASRNFKILDCSEFIHFGMTGDRLPRC